MCIKGNKASRGLEVCRSEERSEKKVAIKSKAMTEKELISAQQDLAEERYNKSVANIDATMAAKESLTARYQIVSFRRQSLPKIVQKQLSTHFVRVLFCYLTGVM